MKRRKIMIELIAIEVYSANSEKKLSNIWLNKNFENIKEMEIFVNNFFENKKLYILYPFYRVIN